MNYKHSQPGYLILIFVGVVVAFLFFASSKLDYSWITKLIILLIVVLFYSLNVEVDKNFILVKFGVGVIFRKISLSDVESCKVVKNRWYNGWGIRRISNGWMFNISGFDAVELKLKNGKVFRIGSDDASKLEKAILKAKG